MTSQTFLKPERWVLAERPRNARLNGGRSRLPGTALNHFISILRGRSKLPRSQEVLGMHRKSLASQNRIQIKSIKIQIKAKSS